MSSEIIHLLKLLDDPDQEVFYAIERKIVSYGRAAVPDLEMYWENNVDSLVQNRIEGLIQKINSIHLKRELGEWIKNGSDNLLYGCYLVSLFQYPELEFSHIETSFNVVKRDLWLEMNNRLTPLEKVHVLNHILFQVHKFQGVRSNPSAVQNYFINNLLDTKKGNQYSLVMLYASLAQSVRFPIYGLKIPNNYLLAYHDAELAKYAHDDLFEAVFYINPYNSGTVFGPSDLTKMFKQYNIPVKDEFYHPSGNVYFIMQIFNALQLSYKNLGYTDKVNKIESIIRFINKELRQ